MKITEFETLVRFARLVRERPHTLCAILWHEAGGVFEDAETSENLEFCSCGGPGMGCTIPLNGLEYIQCAHCGFPMTGTGRIIKDYTVMR